MSKLPDGAPPSLQTALDSIKPGVADRISRLVDIVLDDALRRSASDVHFEPTPRGLEVRYRLDGVLHTLAWIDRGLAVNIVARLKVLAELLTYRHRHSPGRQLSPRRGRSRRRHARQHLSDDPGREGRRPHLPGHPPGAGPGAAGPRRRGAGRAARPDAQRTGAIFLTGPSGSGKTTTIYACLRYLRPGRATQPAHRHH